MKIFVINLERDFARRKSIEQQFESCQLPFEFSKGVLGSTLSTKQKNVLYSDKGAFRNQCRSLVPAEIGCALSHITIYRKMIDDNIDCACIFEDDVILPDNLGFYLKEIEKYSNKTLPEVILLSPAETINKGIILDENYSLKKFKDGFYASSYIVNNAGAKALLKELFPVKDVADCWFRLSRHKVVNLRVVSPPLVIQDQNSFGSSTTIDIKKHNQFDLIKKARFKLCRIFWLSVDYFLALYHRSFRPYSGILKEKK